MAEKRRRRWVLPVLLLAGAGAVVASRARAHPAADDHGWAPVPPAPEVTARPAPPAEPAPATAPEPPTAGAAEPAPVAGPPSDPGPEPVRAEEPAPAPRAARSAPAAASGGTGVAALVDAAPDRAAPFGPGSAAPGPDGGPPGPEFTIKGKAQSRVYHGSGSPYYSRTRAEVWFRTPEDAEAAGFRPYRSRRKA